MTHPQSVRAAIALLTAVALALAACDGDNKGSSVATTSATTTGSAPTTAPTTAKKPLNKWTGDDAILATATNTEVLNALKKAGALTPGERFKLDPAKCPPPPGEPELPVAARDRELLVSSQDHIDLATLQADLSKNGMTLDKLGSIGKDSQTTFRAFLKDPLPPDILDRIPSLQRDRMTIDLNYLHPYLPNNGFRPDDDPFEASAAPTDQPGTSTARVLVIDSAAPDDPSAGDIYSLGTSPSDPRADYGIVPPENLVSGLNGHGSFVISIIQRLAPQAPVVLKPVVAAPAPNSQPWPLMIFDEADLISSLQQAYGLASDGSKVAQPFDVVNLSLGGAACSVQAQHLNLAAEMARLGRLSHAAGSSNSTLYIAAAGNDGANEFHAPAAFRDPAFVMAASQRNSDMQEDVWWSPEDLATRVVAVGSWDGTQRYCYSNYGDWVAAWADGHQVGRYALDKWAVWNGTSFATAHFTGVLVGAGAVPNWQTLGAQGISTQPLANTEPCAQTPPP